MLKNEPRRYDVVALRDTRLAMMNRGTFVWLFENSVGFNRFLVRQLNERLGQFIGLLEYGRTLDATARLARSIASLFNPVPLSGPHAASRDHPGGNRSALGHLPANCQPVPEAAGKEGLLRLEYGGVTILSTPTVSSCATIGSSSSSD